MTNVVTLTINPAIDASTSVERLVPFRKLRCLPMHRDPGGGGINVARVIVELGGEVETLCPVGGATGELLRRLLDRQGIPNLVVPVAEETREDFMVFEQATGKEFRFIMPGPRMNESEWKRCLELLAGMRSRPQFVVLSGSLPPDVPTDFYARAIRIAKGLGARPVLDTSGDALRAGLEEGVYLVKPNRQELSDLLDGHLRDENACIDAGMRLVQNGRAEIVALTLGDRGALLVTEDRVARALPLSIKPVSTVGAGDSFLAAMIQALVLQRDLVDAFRYAAAAGSAALLAQGTGLCRRQAVERLYPNVVVHEIAAVERRR
jgi:6-phosphofructokinase 2